MIIVYHFILQKRQCVRQKLSKTLNRARCHFWNLGQKKVFRLSLTQIFTLRFETRQESYWHILTHLRKRRESRGRSRSEEEIEVHQRYYNPKESVSLNDKYFDGVRWQYTLLQSYTFSFAESIPTQKPSVCDYVRERPRKCTPNIKKKKMAVSVGSKVNTPFGSGVVCSKRKDGGVDVVRFFIFRRFLSRAVPLTLRHRKHSL